MLSSVQIIKPSVTSSVFRTTRGQHRSADSRSDEHELNKSSKVGVGGQKM